MRAGSAAGGAGDLGDRREQEWDVTVVREVMHGGAPGMPRELWGLVANRECVAAWGVVLGRGCLAPTGRQGHICVTVHR